MDDTNNNLENEDLDFEAQLNEDQRKKVKDKMVSEQELIDSYQKYYDKNKALKMLKNLRKKTRTLPGIVREPTQLVIELLGYLTSALDNEKLPKSLKALVIGAIGYIILPLDLIPDSVIGIGFIDDIVSTLGVVKTTKEYSKFDLKQLDALLDAEADSSTDIDETETTEEN